ncbi:MAG: hypothetical protein IID38_04200 [Planctomycetes bacterium]|nr:hypothetical protein [Planctomycetota bacterium]
MSEPITARTLRKRENVAAKRKAGSDTTLAERLAIGNRDITRTVLKIALPGVKKRRSVPKMGTGRSANARIEMMRAAR